MKTIGIAGGSGFVGRHLAALLSRSGYEVIIFSRRKAETAGNIRFAQWHPDRKEMDTSALALVDAMINLAGAGVMEHRWTDAYKKEIISSRVAATHFLLDQLRAHAPNCKTYLATSATGFYGPDRPGVNPFKEDAPPYPDFLGKVCEQWEEASLQAGKSYRTIVLRLGIVLGKDGGAYPQFAGPMKFGILPILGTGNQMISWIHVNDVAALMKFSLEQNQIQGIFNAVAPYPVTHKTLMKTIAHAKGGMKIPVPAPSFLLKIMLGESSTEILKSCTASAAKTLASGFAFQYPSIEQAAADLASS